MRHAALLGMLVVVCSGNREAEVESEGGAPVDTGATSPPTSSPTFRQLSTTAIETSIKALKTAGGGGVTFMVNGVAVTRALEEVKSSTKEGGGENVILQVQYAGDASDWTEAAQLAGRQSIAAQLAVSVDRVEFVRAFVGSVQVQYRVLNGPRTPVPAPFPTPGGDDGLSGGIIAVIVICCVLFVGGVVFVIVWFCCCDSDDSGDKEKDTASNTSKTDVEAGAKTDNAPDAAGEGAGKEQDREE